MKRHILLVLFLLLATISCSCLWETAYYFTVNNQSDYSITVVVDMITTDNCPSMGSQCRHIAPHDVGYVSEKEPWSKIIKDSIHIYILNRDLIDLPSYRLLSEEDANRITEDMILDQTTIYHNDSNNGYFEIVFRSPDTSVSSPRLSGS